MIMAGRPRQEPTRLIRLRVSLVNGLRKEFPSVSTDSDRVANALDFYCKVQQGVNGLGSFIYGKNNWKKVIKK